MKNIVFLLFSIMAFSYGSAQHTTGMLTLKVEDYKMPQMEMEGVDPQQMEGMMSSMMESMKVKIYFKPGMQVSHTNMMGMMNMMQYHEGSKMTQYMDMMGQKIKVVSDTKDPASMGMTKEQMKKMSEMSKVTYDKSDTKKILGFDCYRADITMDIKDVMPKGQEVPAGMDKMNMTMYITDAIKVDQFYMQQAQSISLSGMPLQMSMNMGGMTFIMVATEFKEDIDMSVFDAPEGDYREMTLDELQNMGLGFGN